MARIAVLARSRFSVMARTSRNGVDGAFASAGEKSKSCIIKAPSLSSSRGKSSGRGATRWYSWYIGVCVMNSAAAAPTCSCCASISG